MKKFGNMVVVCALLAGCGAEGDVADPGADMDSESLRRPHGPPKTAVPYATNNPAEMKLREKRVRAIYENLIYPTSVAILTGQKSVTDIFQEGYVKGRVTPVGQFLDFNAVVEYFYALAVTPGSIVDGVKFRSLFAGDDKVAVQVDIHFCRAPDGVCDPDVPNSETSQTLTQVGFFQFNRYHRVISIDLNILNLGAASDPPNDPAVHAGAIQQLCTALTIAHIDPTTGGVVNAGTCPTYFDTAEDFPADFPVTANAFQNCVAFMSSIPYGSWNRANSNSVTCRQLHTLLTATDPDKHCPHASPGGGGSCIEFPYSSYYDQAF